MWKPAGHNQEPLLEDAAAERVLNLFVSADCAMGRPTQVHGKIGSSDDLSVEI